MTVSDSRIWVHGNATEHLAEYATAMIMRGVSPDLVDIGVQAQLQSLQAAMESAISNGIPYNRLINAEGWELRFAEPREEGLLPVLIHALPIR
jgi:filamentous hemagglutinin